MQNFPDFTREVHCCTMEPQLEPWHCRSNESVRRCLQNALQSSRLDI